MSQFKHLKSFPLNYEVSDVGEFRMLSSHGYVFFRPYREDDGLFVDIDVLDKTFKCLVAEMILASFKTSHFVGNSIEYIDGNKYHVVLSNLKTIWCKELDREDASIIFWQCKSKATYANERTTYLQEQITSKDVFSALRRTGYQCFYCGEYLDPKTWQLDHFIPLSKKGRNNALNLRASCPECNAMKGNLSLSDFICKAYSIIERHTVKVQSNGETLTLVSNG